MRTTNPTERIEEIDRRLAQLPKGTLTYKNINGKKQPYMQRTVDGRSVSCYVRMAERSQLLLEVEERASLMEEKKRLLAYCRELESILARNPYLAAKVGIGYQDFEDYACGRRFYIDKTYFITDWLRREEKLTLITRPRRFGKTMLLSTVEHFLDPRFAAHPEHFQKLSVWQDADSRRRFGTIPVISVSFGSCKGNSYEQALGGMVNGLYQMYDRHDYLAESTQLSEEERGTYCTLRHQLSWGSTDGITYAIQRLARLLYRHHGVRPVILMDEYDTPLLEAYTDGYWDAMIGTCRQLFHNTFKENSYFSRAIITGVMRVSKNSLFSDMNNLKVCSVTSELYRDCCGFTEPEVMDALKCQNIDELQAVKQMYDGFIFGGQQDIYNPWSICNYMCSGNLESYWINTSSNRLIGEVIRRHPAKSKYELEQLMRGETVHKEINENVAIQYLDGEENSLWSLLLATGYIKAEHVKKEKELTICEVSVTNEEVMGMFRHEIRGMFFDGDAMYNHFTEALLRHQPEEMNDILTDIAYNSMSYFDVASRPSERAPENFYHGLVLGLIVSMKDDYRIVSNRESGRGRYDIAMYPLQKTKDAFIIEFKVLDEKRETDLEQAAQNALRQIEEKCYETDLLAAGIEKDQIYRLGIAFSGKEVKVLLAAPDRGGATDESKISD